MTDELRRLVEKRHFGVTEPIDGLLPVADDENRGGNRIGGRAQAFAPTPDELGDQLLSQGRNLLVVSGEADEERVRVLELAWGGERVQVAKYLPLPRLGALLENSIFIGHDSGISHLAAAVGARCVLLFGPTDPAIWAPVGERVMALAAPQRDLRLLAVDSVLKAIERAYELMRIGISTYRNGV